jgi:hypothetical protein
VRSGALLIGARAAAKAAAAGYRLVMSTAPCRSERHLEAPSDQDENKAAAVKACQELIADDPVFDNRRAGVATVPGLIIHVIHSAPSPREPIDVTPETVSAPADESFAPGGEHVF